jgi:hypothetical protein
VVDALGRCLEGLCDCWPDYGHDAPGERPNGYPMAWLATTSQAAEPLARSGGGAYGWNRTIAAHFTRSLAAGRSAVAAAATPATPAAATGGAAACRNAGGAAQ